MSLTCTTCGRENPDDARFCSSCAAPLLATTGAARRERKFATALFADLVGSTALGEREDPEVVQSLVGRAFDRLAREIERYGGLLEKFMGDAVLAVFGVPAAHEDDPERAVRCALEMHAVLSELNRGFAAENRPQLAMRIGVEAGEVLVDLERATGPRDRMLTGDAVNTAARLQAAAEPGRVLVGPAVYASTKAVIDFAELAPLELKGKAELVPAWQALRVKARRRGERAPLGLEARLVGRDEELELLKQTLHRVESESRPALVTVLGPAGVGKSRLTWELLKYVEGLPQDFYWRKGRCLAYGNVSYSALAEAVKAQCEILEDDPPEVAGRKVDRSVEELFGDLEVASHVRALVGAGEERSFGREELFDAWRRFLEHMAARYPLVLVLEDIHWADGGLLDFVDHLADWAQGPIFVVTLARPELLDLRPSWGGGKRNYSAIYLDPLSPEENEAMIDDLLAGALPEELKELVVERSEGNPLFTEEIVRMFIDRGVLRATEAARWELARPVDDVEVPRSIHGLIAARLDTLPADEKALLQDAAVIGRVFWLGAVARLAGRTVAEAREVLGRLRVKEIVVPREPPIFSGESELSFRHVLIRDVAYESLPKTLRAEKHQQAAAWAEERAGDRAEENAELIASHLDAALLFGEELGAVASSHDPLAERALRWARLAAERAIRLWQVPEALRWHRRAVEIGESIGADPGTLADLWEGYASASLQASSMEEQYRAHLRALELAGSIAGREAQVGRLEAWAGFVAFRMGDDEAVRRHLDRALELLEPLGESTELAVALERLGAYHWRRGNDEEARRTLRRAVEVADRMGANATHAHALQTLALVPTGSAAWPESLAMLEESLRLARSTNELQLVLRATNNLASSLPTLAPDYPRGEALLLEGLEAARRSGHTAMEGWIVGTLGEYAFETGRLDEGARLVREGLELQRSIGDVAAVSLALTVLAMIELIRGHREEALALYGEGRGLLDERREGQADHMQAIIEGLGALAVGDVEPAARTFLDGADRGSYSAWGAEVRLLHGIRALARRGRAGEARPVAAALHEKGFGRPHWEAFARWADGLVAADPGEATDALRDAAGRFEAIGRPVERALILADLGPAETRTGHDGRAALEEARDILLRTGARLFLPEVEAALAAVSA